MKKLLTLGAAILCLQGYAQTKSLSDPTFVPDSSTKWDLQRCIIYARQNNIPVKQTAIQAASADLQLRQARLNQYPNLTLSTGLGVQFGLSIDRTTNVYSNTQAIYQNIGVSSGIVVYNWGRLKNSVAVSQFNAEAALADVDRAGNDLGLNVATYYLQVLANKEQIAINELQASQTQAQINITGKQVEAGALPELNLVELQAQLATDSSNIIAARSAYEQSILSLKGLLSLDAAAPFELLTPAVESIPVPSLAEMQPEDVYQIALHTQPLQRGDSLRIRSSQKNTEVYKSMMYPTLSFGVNLATNFYNPFQQITGASFAGYSPVTGAESIVNVGGTNYFVQSPVFKFTQSTRSFGQLFDGYTNQLANNFGQGVGFNLSVPIFNNGQNRINYEQSKLTYKNTLLQKKQDDLTLKLNIYTAYSNAVSALQKFNAGIKSVQSNQQAYDFALKRYNVGLLSTIDLLTNQNNLLRAKLQQVANQFDYVFKMKVLEYYKNSSLVL